jgi:hypothetical protein
MVTHRLLGEKGNREQGFDQPAEGERASPSQWTSSGQRHGEQQRKANQATQAAL